MAIQHDAIRLKREWSEPSDLYGWSAILRCTLPLLALLWLAPVLADNNVFAPWLLSPLVGLFAYRLTVVMHDCTHYTLFRGRRLNAPAGSLLGAISGVDFRSFCDQHWRHHRSYGEPGDPQGFHYEGLKTMARRDLCWHFLKPLLGFNLRHTFAESVVAPSNVVRLLRTGEIVVVMVVQLALLTLVTGFGRHPFLVLLPFVSTSTFGLFFSQLRGIAEHGVVDAAADTHEVRSHAPDWLDRIFLYDVNFNYHAEHHEHPQIPSCHLPAVHTLSHAQPASKSMLHTLRAMYSATRRSHA